MAGDVALVVFAMLLGGIVKATLGFGAPIVAIPIVALGLGGEDAVVLMAFPGVVANAIMVWTTREARAETIDMWLIVLPSIPAAAISSVILTELPDRGVNLVLATMLVAYLVQYHFRPDAVVTAEARRWMSPAVGVGGGLSQGASGISLPFIGPYLNALKLQPEPFTHQICMFFLVPTVVQIATFGAAGEYDARRVVLSLVGAAAFLVTLAAGGRLRRAMTPAVFNSVVLWMLGVAAVALAFRALF